MNSNLAAAFVVGVFACLPDAVATAAFGDVMARFRKGVVRVVREIKRLFQGVLR